MESSTKYAGFRLSVLFLALFFFVGIYMPYWPVWLESRNLDPTEIAILLGLGPWARTVANPIAGRLGTRSVLPGRLVRLLAILAALAYGCFLLADGFAAIFLIMLVIGFVFSPIVPLIDGLALTERLDYGRVRLWGSLGFILASLLGGWLLEGRSEQVILWTVVACAAVLAACTFLAPAPPRKIVARRDREASTQPSMWAMLRRPGLLLFLTACCLLHASHAVLYVFGTLHWRAADIDEGTIGLLWSTGVVAEVVLFAMASRFQRRLRPLHWLLLAALGGVLRWPVLASTTALGPLFAAQALHALTFAAMQTGAMAYIRSRIDEAEIPMATTLYSATATGVAYGIALQLAGLLYETWSGGAYMAMGLCSAVSILPIAILLMRGRTPAPNTVSQHA
jgi:PPP family 3-phenylpropionic acid transporter